MKHAISANWLANPNHAHSHLPRKFSELTWISFSLSKWRLLCSLSDHIDLSQLMLTIEPRMVSIVWACSPISLEHTSFWCPFLDTHLTIHHSNIFVQIIAMFGFPPFYLSKIWLGCCVWRGQQGALCIPTCSTARKSTRWIQKISLVLNDFSVSCNLCSRRSDWSIYVDLRTTLPRTSFPKETLLVFWRSHVSFNQKAASVLWCFSRYTSLEKLTPYNTVGEGGLE